VEASRCPPGHAIFSVTIGERAPVFVDATAGGPALREIDGLGLSPIGEFADFEQAPAPVREGFARVASCLEHDRDLPIARRLDARRPIGREPSRGPILLVAALALAAVAASPRKRPRRRTLLTTALLLAMVAATFALARALVGPSFFHQNGHGPNWIGYALGEPCAYGPGFRELFGWLASLRADAPEATVFTANGLLAATCPVSVWIVARRVGARAPLAWAMAFAVMLDPLLWRMAFSESYYVPYTALPLAATALMLSFPTLRTWSPRFLACVGAAALLLAQAARVHPVGWVAVAVAPLVFLARRGAPRRNLVHAAIAVATTGLVAAVTSARPLAGVLGGEMGERFQQWRRGWTDELGPATALALAAMVACTLLPRLRGRVMPRVALLVVVGGAATLGTSLLGIDVDWLRAAHWHPFIGSFVAAAVGVASPYVVTARASRIAAAVVASLTIASAALHWRWAAELPTDALELRLALAWRREIPPDARLVAVENAGVTSLQLPFYGRADGAPGERSAPIVRLDARDTPPSLPSFGDTVFYYRSSLCSTAAARPWCEDLERTAVLEPLLKEELPARPSTHAITYEDARVRVGLYRVRPRP
jgi:hypothetical protein